MHIDTDRVTILLYVILKHFKRSRVKKLFFQSSVKSGMMTPYKKTPPSAPWKHLYEWRLVSYSFLHHTWTKLSPGPLRLWDFTESKKCWLGQASAQSAAQVGTIANSRSSQPQLCPNESQNPLRTEIKPLLWATSSSAALPLQTEVPPYCSIPSYSLCLYIPLFAICHYWTKISFNTFVNALQEVLGCYWTVLQIPLFQPMQANSVSLIPYALNSVGLLSALLILQPRSLSPSPFC